MHHLVGSLKKQQFPIYIWGAGVAGLMMAVLLKRAGQQVKVLEKSSRAGGKVGTEQTPFGPVEWGPNAFFATEEIEKFFHSLKLKPIRATAKLKKLMVRDGKFTSLVSSRIVLKIICGLFKRPPSITENTTVSELFTPLLGKRLSLELTSLALQGIYGVSSDQLGVLSIWPQLENIKAKNYWQLLPKLKRSREKAHSLSFSQGMQEYIDAMIRELGVDLILNHREKFDANKNNIVCTDARTAAEILRPDFPDVANLLQQVPYTTICSATYFLRQKPVGTQQAFGMLFSADAHNYSLGALFNHEIFTDRVQGEAKSSITFIARKLSDIESDFAILGWSKYQVCHQASRQHDLGLPIYSSERRKILKNITQKLSHHEGLVLFGNYVAGISLREMYHQATSFQRDFTAQ